MPTDPPPDAPRPARLIVPGAEPEHAASPAPRIVLPPGTTAEVADEVPEYPRLRPLLLMPFRDGERELLLVSDPLGVMPGQPVLGLEGLALLQLLDGTFSVQDITAALMRESKDLRVAGMVRNFISQIDQLLMLDSPRFEAAHRALREAYHPLEIRPAAFEGRSYPADRATLERFLDDHFVEAERMRETAGEAKPSDDARPRALLAPHLDPRRAGAVIARALLELGPAGREPLRVVVFGTGHSLLGDTFALTRKHFETPLGKARCDTAFVDAVAEKLGEAAYRSELAHREEHSIEFLAVYLRRRLGERPFTIVPILCGGFQALLEEGKAPRDDASFEALIDAVRAADRALGGATLYLAGVDLSHAGPRFGDPALDERVRAEVEAKDREAITAAQRGDAEGWFEAIRAHDDSTRICGLAPTYALLRCAEPGTGRLLGYRQSSEPDSTVVSVAALVWP